MNQSFSLLPISLVALPMLMLQLMSPGVMRAQETPFDPEAFQIDLELVVEGLDSPVFMVEPDDGSERFFIAEQGGLVRVMQDGPLLEQPLLDISDKVSTGPEQGLLGLALHPDFATNGLFYVDYTDVEGDTQVVRYTIDAGSPNVADPGSAATILQVDQPAANHNGGMLAFGPDGYLYIGFGDGGSQGDPSNHGQDTSTLLGSILRIDVDGDAPYAIPPDNPLIDDPGAAAEIWQFGLRNPWRFSFDRATGDLYIGDVGGSSAEEINLAPAGTGGLNYGWVLMEGFECRTADGCDDGSLTLPIYAYEHGPGCTVIGGYVYRGDAAPALDGVYLFADYCSGEIWGMGIDQHGDWVASEPLLSDLRISSFSEDLAGEVYVLGLEGAIYRIVA